MPTALELLPTEIKQYRDGLRRQPVPSPSVKAKRGEQETLLRRAARTADLFEIKFGARRVILFGSLARQAWFVPNSDVNLAVEG